MELLSVTTACPLTTEQVERERERERERVSTGLHEYKHSRVQSLLLMITLTSTTELFCTAFKISDRSEVRACIFLKLAITSNATSKTDDHYPITWPTISMLPSISTLCLINGECKQDLHPSGCSLIFCCKNLSFGKLASPK